MTQTALVTGAGRGIGLGIAKLLGGEGLNIVVMDIHQEADIQSNLDSIREEGAPDVLYYQGDVTNKNAREECINAAKERFGNLNVLVNNAGISPTERLDILEASEESYEKVMRINLQGPYFLTQAVAREMVEQKEKDSDFPACIVNISSISATVASTNRGEYCLSKAGVSMATRLWSVRLSEWNIPVYEVRPGLIQTDMTAKVRDKYSRLIEEGLCLQRRWGYPEDIGKAVRMLVRGDLAYSTGQVIQVEGGMTQQTL